MRIFVLGGQGFVGSAIVRGAQRRRHAVTAITRQDYASWRGQSCDLLINANGNSKKFLADQDPSAEFDASVASVLRSLLDFPCKQYVYLSSIDVYPRVDDCRMNRETARIDPRLLSRYGLHKVLAEQLVRNYAPRWLILRLGGMVGDGLWKNSIFDILQGRPLRVHADSAYQYLNTHDVAEIVLALVGRRAINEVFNVCGDGCMTLREVASLAGSPRVRQAVDRPRREHYEVNTAKLRQVYPVPKTQATIGDFVGG